MANDSKLQLSVSGVAINPGIPGSVYVPTRKFYNASYFHDDRYRHEIANHFRDFKMRPRLRRRKRGLLACSYGKPAVTTVKREMPYEYLPELPMAVQELPRFDREAIAPTGQPRRLCEEKHQDLVCNDILKRIQKAAAEKDDSETLKFLARRHLQRFQGFAPRIVRRPRANVYQSLEQCDKWHNEVKDLQKPSKNKQRRRSLGKLESVDVQQQRRQPQEFPFENSCGVTQALRGKRNFVSEPPRTLVDSNSQRGRANTLTYYLQLAADYYEQGFLSNIKYLENVGKRNQLRRKQQTLRQTTTTTTTKCTSASSVTRSESHTVANAPQHKGVAVDGNPSSSICNPILKIIAQKRSFRIYRYNEKEREHPDAFSAHWPIRVQIKPADSSAAAITQTNGTGNVSGNSTSPAKNPSYRTAKDRSNATATKDCGYSMNDYLNGNLQLQQAPNSNYLHQLSSFHYTYPGKDLLIDTLIDNLQELEIAEHSVHLPRITLSDYSHRYPTEYTSPLDVDTALLSGKQPLNSIILRRQESIDLPSCSLDIPFESPQYHSEARPP